MLSIIHKDKNPKFAIVTPLRIGDKISKETKVSVKRNDIPFIWVSYKSNMNIVKNFNAGLSELKKIMKLPEYVIKIDNDTIWNRKTLDYMVKTLDTLTDISGYRIGYCYVSFEYQGAVNHKFPAILFDPNKMRQNNYISSNVMFYTKILEEFEMPDDDYYKRLLDWAYFLKLLKNRVIGIPCQKGYFIAYANPDSISAGSTDDFRLKYARVKNDFIGDK